MDTGSHDVRYDTYVKGNPEAEASSKAAKNKGADEKQYKRYVDALGKNAPKTFADFQKMKYNDSREWEALKRNVKLFAKSTPQRDILPNTRPS